jgi:hypothetical protein
MTQKQAFLLQTLLEALIPLIGYVAWGWDLSFILLFYLLDWLLAFGILIAKGRKRYLFSQNSTERSLLVRRVASGAILMTAACAAFGLSVVLLQPELSWTERILSFLTYKDMGIEQGYVLVPLIVLNGVMVYRQQFVMTGRFRVQDMSAITRPFIQQGLVLLGCAGALLGIASLFSFSEEILIFILIAGTSAYRWLVIRRS